MAINFLSEPEFEEYSCRRCKVRFETDEPIRDCPKCGARMLERVTEQSSRAQTPRISRQGSNCGGGFTQTSRKMQEQARASYAPSWDEDTGVSLPEPPADGIPNLGL